MKIRLVSVARAELQDALDWYGTQSQELREEFLAEFDQCARRIKRFPESCPVLKDGMRRALVNLFPYGLWYAIETDSVVVYAVAHLHREPRSWSERA